MKAQKLSRYNIIFDNDNKNIWMFNTLSGSMISLKPEIYNLLKGNNVNEIKTKHNDIFINLKKNGIILDSDLDEINLLKYMYWKTKFLQNKLNLSLTITKDCNFDCKYCYEKKENISFSDDLIKRIIKLVNNKKDSIKYLDIGWFGGEPMMKMDIIEDMTNKFKDICKKNNIIYSSYITTNGYFLNLANFEKLLDLNVKSIQITIDGPKEYHDRLRPLKGDVGTYDKIISNLLEIRSKYTRENLPKDFVFHLRVNVSEMNKDSLKGWLKNDFPKELKDLIEIYFARIFSDGEKGSAASINAMDNDIFPINRGSSSGTVDLDKFVQKLKFNTNVQYGLHSSFLYCGADYYNNYVILPNGDIAKCGVTMEKFGELNKNGEIIITNQGDYIKWMAKDPFTFNKPFEECENCKLFPICMGGCSRIYKKFNKVGCFQYKNNIKEYLKSVRDSLMENESE